MLTQDDFQIIGQTITADCRTVDEARKAAGLPNEATKPLLQFLRKHGLERTLFYISLRPTLTCSMCQQVPGQCRCDEPIGFVPTP